ncbi:MAG: ABC transporter ATP-binding protein [Planctomycetaceae bacterium]
MAPLLSIIEAQKSYGSHRALSGVDFDLYPGELLALLGPNGAGKTTLIRAICGRHRLDAGFIELMGEPIRHEDKRQRAMLGFVPQELAIYPDLTAEQNLDVFGRLHGVTGSQLEIKIEEVLRWTQLESRRHDKAGSFSGGMQRRLNIACGVLHDPIVLLLDEPTVGVDPQSRERIFEMLMELKTRGTAILLTTHQLDEAEARCDRIVIVDKGQTIASGTLQDLVAATVGSTQRLTVQYQDEDDSERYLVTETYELSNVADELPQVLDETARLGRVVEGLKLANPSLQDVFLHLTGRELRE